MKKSNFRASGFHNSDVAGERNKQPRKAKTAIVPGVPLSRKQRRAKKKDGA